MTLAQLLVVQGHDSTLDRLVHQRAHVPELEALAACDAERARIEDRRAPITAQRHELEREQKRREDEVALIEDRRNLETARLYDGSVTAHKDLQAIQAEIDTLARRQEAIEDQVLELMERADPLDAQLGELDALLAGVEERRAAIERSLEASRAAIDDEIEAERRARAEAVADVADELVDEYERVRAECAGIGIAQLNGKTCEGCHLQLSAVAYDRLRKEPADAIVHCPECRRILVR